jgi:S1-C subfamily serine protease
MAARGKPEARLKLAMMYFEGKGVPQDYVLAHMWANLAASSGTKEAFTLREKIAQTMTRSQMDEAQRLTRQWNDNQKTKTPLPYAEAAIGGKLARTGTGFIVNRQGHILTNYHVIENCQSIRATVDTMKAVARVIGSDGQNDLALLQIQGPVRHMARFREGKSARSGENVIVTGFPLPELLSHGINVSTGTVTSLAGLRNDTRFFQLSAPVQQGNSGGPVMDQSGNVVGIVTGKLNAMNVAKITGDIPQNVNFAMNAAIAKSFLDSFDVGYESAGFSVQKTATEIGNEAKNFTVLLECFK